MTTQARLATLFFGVVFGVGFVLAILYCLIQYVKIGI
jgi:uncharacterized membrane protein YciS (DUF1049 family)